jgi:hypothetical protein
MKKTGFILMILIIICSLLAGCAYHIGNFSALAAGTYRAENIKASSLVAKNVRGESCESVILFIPTGIPRLDEAVKEATAKNKGDFMMNARTYYSFWFLPLIYWQNCLIVEGDVYKTNN